MINNTVDSVQGTAERVAGFTLLFFMILSILHYTIIDLNLVVSGNTAEIANFIKTEEVLFRIGIVMDLILYASGMIMSLALYEIFRTKNRSLVLLALILMLVNFVLGIVTEFSSSIVLLLLNGDDYLAAFSTEQLQTLVGVFLNLRFAGYDFGMLFFGLGFLAFSCVFLKSGYVPKKLAVWGIVTFSLLVFFVFAKIIIPNQSVMHAMTETSILLASVSALFFQISIGIWFLAKSVNTQQRGSLSAEGS